MVLSTGSSNPHAQARVLCHYARIPWEHVRAVVNALEHQAQLSASLVELTDRLPAELDEYCKEFAAAEHAFELCASPIEEIFLAYLVGADPEQHFHWLDPHDPAATSGHWSPSLIQLSQQRNVAGFRVDFALDNGPGGSIAVEIDGHDFHERTKQQAARDRSRDRALQEAGWKILRFTGSEVWRDPNACAKQALRFALGRTTAE